MFEPQMFRPEGPKLGDGPSLLMCVFVLTCFNLIHMFDLRSPQEKVFCSPTKPPIREFEVCSLSN